MIWLWRRTTDTSPGAFVTKLEHDLSVGREVRYHEFVAYSLPERCARRLLRGPNNLNTITVCRNSERRIPMRVGQGFRNDAGPRFFSSG